MSVIVKDSADDIWLYCKGADSAVLPLIINGNLQQATVHVTDFSMVCYSLSITDERLLDNNCIMQIYITFLFYCVFHFSFNCFFF